MKWVLRVGRVTKIVFVLTLVLSFQNCGQKFSTPENKTSSSTNNQGSTSAPVSDRNPTSTPSPNPTPSPISVPAPNPVAIPFPQPTPSAQIPNNNAGTINPNQAGDTTVQTAAQYPTDSHFERVRWAGVFDSRVSGTVQYLPTSWADVSAVGQARCITNDMINTAGDGSKYATIYWYFTNNRFDGNEALQTLRISPGENVAYKVILPPGTSESTVSDQAGLWGNVWTQSTARNTAPTGANWQSYGGFNPLVSYAGRANNAAFVITQPLTQETFGVFWFQHRGEGDNRVIAVKELIVNLTIKDINLYNQWIQRTAGLRCL